MMDTREINSFPVVTSLSSSDYLLTDSGKKILEQNVGRRVVNASLGEGAKWIRIAEFSGSAVGIISITNSWYYQVPQSLLIAFAVPGVISSVPVYTILNLLLGKTEVFNKARMVYSTNGTFSTKCYLEVYQHISTETAYIVEMQNHRNATALCELGSIPEGWSTKEFTFTAVGGGVIYLLSNNYAILQKGGLRDDADERINQSSDKRNSARCNDAQRSLRKLGYLCRLGRLLHYFYDGRNTTSQNGNTCKIRSLGSNKTLRVGIPTSDKRIKSGRYPHEKYVWNLECLERDGLSVNSERRAAA